MCVINYVIFWCLSFDCAQIYSVKRHPPFARARLQTPFCSFIFTGVVRVSCFAKRHPPSLDLRGAMNFYVRDFNLASSLIKDFPALGSSLVKIFMPSNFSPWALRSQGLFCLRLFAHKDFYVFEFLPWALRSQGLFCLILFAHKDFVI